MEDSLKDSKEKLLTKLDSELVAAANFMEQLKLLDSQEGNDDDAKMVLIEYNEQLRSMVSIAKDFAVSSEERNKKYRNLAAELNREGDDLDKNISELELKLGFKPEVAANVESPKLVSPDKNDRQVDLENAIELQAAASIIETTTNPEPEPTSDDSRLTNNAIPAKLYREQLRIDEIKTPETPKLVTNSEETKKLLKECGIDIVQWRVSAEEPPIMDYKTPVTTKSRNIFLSQNDTPKTPEITSNYANFNV